VFQDLGAGLSGPEPLVNGPAVEGNDGFSVGERLYADQTEGFRTQDREQHD
jgi:hypothetical protein